MLSDLRVIDSPLDKEACTECGLVRRPHRLPSALFESGYRLYDHPPGATREAARQEVYAEWIASQVATPPGSILDLGCGNGSLLLALGRRWPDAQLRGLDPSPESVGRARDALIDAQCGVVGQTRLEPADLVVTVNVIEHVEDPRSFVRSVATLVTPGGVALVACPDGGRAWLELLFADHLWSFAPAHLSQLAAEAGLDIVDWSAAPAALGFFQLIRLQRAMPSPRRIAVARDSGAGLTHAKRRYLQTWSALEQDLLVRCGQAPSLVCFGMGEAAALLRAYAPALWCRVTLCTADRPEGDMFGDLPVVHYTGGRFEWPVLLGVRPEAQAGLARRLEDNGCAVIRWDDYVAA